MIKEKKEKELKNCHYHNSQRGTLDRFVIKDSQNINLNEGTSNDKN